jgi:AcrR family transcriptional regulator
MIRFKRARSDEDKTKRRKAILKIAWRLYEENGGQLPTVSHIAKKAKLSKGAIYLYFRSKEEIYLQLLMDQLRLWADSANSLMYRTPGSMSEQESVSIITKYIRENPLVIKLGILIQGFFEDNANADIIVENKTQLSDILSDGGERLSFFFPEISKSDSLQLMLQIYSIISGLWQLASMPEQARKVLAERGVQAFDSNFSDIVQKSVHALIKGTIALNS